MKPTLEEQAQLSYEYLLKTLQDGQPIKYQPFAYAGHMPEAVRKKVERKKPSVGKELQGILSPQVSEHDKSIQLLNALSSSQKKAFGLISSHSKRRFEELEEEDRYYDNYLLQNDIMVGDPHIKEKIKPPKSCKVNRRLDFDTSSSSHVEEMAIKPFEELHFDNSKNDEENPTKICNAIRSLKLTFNDQEFEECENIDDSTSFFDSKLDFYPDEF
jgi:hypothetical protein